MGICSLQNGPIVTRTKFIDMVQKKKLKFQIKYYILTSITHTPTHSNGQAAKTSCAVAVGMVPDVRVPVV